MWFKEDFYISISKCQREGEEIKRERETASPSLYCYILKTLKHCNLGSQACPSSFRTLETLSMDKQIPFDLHSHQ